MPIALRVGWVLEVQLGGKSAAAVTRRVMPAILATRRRVLQQSAGICPAPIAACTLGVKGSSIYWDVSSIKRSLARKTFSSAPKPRPSENSNPIAPHTRFHASARARPGFPCAPRNAPRRKGGPAEMAMARWPMAALLASVAPIGRHQSDVRGMPPAWNRSAAAELMVGRWH